MTSKKFRIGVFASSKSLVSQIKLISARQPDHIYINTQGLDDAIPIARDMQRNGVEVIVSRRGTAHLLRENLHIPVLSFPHRSLDTLISLKQAVETGRRVLLPAFRQELSNLGMIEDLFDLELVQDIYHDKASLEQIIARNHRRGCEVVVGGSVTQHAAAKFGMRFVEMRTSDDDIAATIENAKSVALSAREQAATARRYRSIIDAASDGIIALDAAGHITTINAAASKIFKIDDQQVLDQPISRLIPDCPIMQVLLSQQPIQDRLTQLKGNHFVFNYLPVVLGRETIGAVCTFRDVGRVMRTEQVVRRSLSKGLVAKYSLNELVHAGPAMRHAINMAKQYAQTDSTVLIMGETGTGKEIFAHGIHGLSARAAQAFVAVNCAALPEQLLESELFGYEEGAFTGSKKGGKPGRFEIAHNGSIFLDEIDSTPQSVQIRLLRVLQEREVMRVGGDRKISIDVRVIAAASRDLRLAVQEGKFRADLYFRLNVLRIQAPPLSRRPEDIPLLLAFFIRLYSDRYNFEPITLPDAYLQQLKQYHWPGNVRQLRNFAERIVMNCSLNCSTDMLQELYRELIEYLPQDKPAAPAMPAPLPLKKQLKVKATANEKQLIHHALEQAHYKKAAAAKLLGISRTTLWRKIRELDI